MNPDRVIAQSEQIAARLTAHFNAVHAGAMRDVPICNPALTVDQIGFCDFGGGTLGIIVTPWFMNLVWVAPTLAATIGTSHALILPAGRIDFTVGDLPGFGPWATCSLFSPMQDFADHDQAVATARQILDTLLTPPEQLPDPVLQKVIGRRALLRGRSTRS